MSWGSTLIERTIKLCGDYNLLTVKADGRILYDGKANYIEEDSRGIKFIDEDGEKVTILYGIRISTS